MASYESYKDGYIKLLNKYSVRPEWTARVATTANRIIKNKQRYVEVSSKTGVPWDVIGVIHNLEAGLSFKAHLHNGDPLSARTRQVPAGRPKVGNPPFTWEESAVDALKYDRLTAVSEWSLPRICYELEKYNGFGNRSKGVNSPYLWSGTDCYSRGKYVADGVWSNDAVSQQIGGIPLLMKVRELESTSPSSIAPNSTKLTRLNQVKTGIKWLANAVGGYFTLDTFGLFKGWADALNNSSLYLVGLFIALGVGYLIFTWLENKIAEDYKEGRYIPSGEMNDDNNPDLIAERSIGRASRSTADEASGSQTERTVDQSGSGEGNSPSLESADTGSKQEHPG